MTQDEFDNAIWQQATLLADAVDMPLDEMKVEGKKMGKMLSSQLERISDHFDIDAPEWHLRRQGRIEDAKRLDRLSAALYYNARFYEVACNIQNKLDFAYALIFFAMLTGYKGAAQP